MSEVELGGTGTIPKAKPTGTMKLKVVGYISEWSLRRIKSNDGIVATTAFDERISNKPNDAQKIALYVMELPE